LRIAQFTVYNLQFAIYSLQNCEWLRIANCSPSQFAAIRNSPPFAVRNSQFAIRNSQHLRTALSEHQKQNQKQNANDTRSMKFVNGGVYRIFLLPECLYASVAAWKNERSLSLA
jgi:hypothetical protein